MKKGLIIGKGWLGKKLENQLSSQFEITTTKRKSDAANCITVDFDEEIHSSIDTSIFDFIIITIPFGKRETLQNLNNRFDRLIQFIGKYNQPIILTSSIGIYPDSELLVNENTFNTSELTPNYIMIENKMRQAFPQLTILRLGGLMGDDRYLSKYLDLTRPNLDEIANHIHYQDVVNVIENCIHFKVEHKIYHVVAPEHPTKREIISYQTKGEIDYSEIKKGKTISSQKLVEELNYQFIYPNPIYFKTFD